jgi:hypothetical protein
MSMMLVITITAAETTTTTSGLIFVQPLNQKLFCISYCAAGCNVRTRSGEARRVRCLLRSTPFLVKGLIMVVVLVAAVAVVVNKSIIGLRAAHCLGASDALRLQRRRIVQRKCCLTAGTAMPEQC